MTKTREARRFHHMTVGEFLTAIRARGMNQREAAIALGVTEGTVSRWISGERRIPDMAKIALRAIPPKKTKQPAA